MEKSATVLFPRGHQGFPSIAENSSDRMSVAQKEWPDEEDFSWRE
jgi:hypothetical protein